MTICPAWVDPVVRDLILQTCSVNIGDFSRQTSLFATVGEDKSVWEKHIKQCILTWRRPKWTLRPVVAAVALRGSAVPAALGGQSAEVVLAKGAGLGRMARVTLSSRVGSEDISGFRGVSGISDGIVSWRKPRYGFCCLPMFHFRQSRFPILAEQNSPGSAINLRSTLLPLCLTNWDGLWKGSTCEIPSQEEHPGRPGPEAAQFAGSLKYGIGGGDVDPRSPFMVPTWKSAGPFDKPARGDENHVASPGARPAHFLGESPDGRPGLVRFELWPFRGLFWLGLCEVREAKATYFGIPSFGAFRRPGKSTPGGPLRLRGKARSARADGTSGLGPLRSAWAQSF